MKPPSPWLAFGVLLVACVFTLRWPAHAQPVPAAGAPLIVKTLPLARDLVSIDGTTLGVPHLGSVPLTTVPGNKYLVVTELHVNGVLYYTGPSSSGSVSISSSTLDLVDSASAKLLLQCRFGQRGTASSAEAISYVSSTGMAVAPGTPIALQYTQDSSWTTSGYTTTVDLHYRIVGYLADR